MAATTSSPQIGWKAAKFDLEGTDGRQHRLAEACGPKGTLVMFICNHCPYVQAVLDDIIRDPYVIDRSQEVARSYDAVCTPDFFGFNANLELQYRGRIYEMRHLQRAPGSGRNLFDAMVQIARTGKGPAEQVPSMGCSIKWRNS